MRRFLSACLIAVPVFALAQAPSTPPPEQPAEPAAAPALPVRRVILYKTGVGYFEHLGNVRNRQSITIRFTSAQLNDVLSSLTVLDLGKGQITGISYNSVAPLEQRLGALRLPLDGSTTQAQMLGSLRGARIEVISGAGAVAGRLLSVEQKTRQRGDETISTDTVSVVTDGGELRTFELSPTVRVRIVERDLRQEIGRYLDLVGSTREQDVRSMVIATAGTGERPLFVSYVSEVPIWKSTYRLVMSTKGRPLSAGVGRRRQHDRRGLARRRALAGGRCAPVVHPEHLAAVLRPPRGRAHAVRDAACSANPSGIAWRRCGKRARDGPGQVRRPDPGRERASYGDVRRRGERRQRRRRTVRADRAGRCLHAPVRASRFLDAPVRGLAGAVRHTGPTGRDHGAGQRVGVRDGVR